jgi:hypothetical protein
MDSLQSRRDEICSKLKSAVRHSRANTAGNLELEKSFSVDRQIAPEKAVRIFCLGSADIYKLNRILSGWTDLQPPLLILFYEDSSKTEMNKKRIVLPKSFLSIEKWISGQSLQKGNVYLSSLEDIPFKKISAQKTSVIAIGNVPDKLEQLLNTLPEHQLIVEEPDASKTLSSSILSRASFVVPYTSLAYHSDDYLKGH